MTNTPVLELLRRVLTGFVKVVEHEIEHAEGLAEEAARVVFNQATDIAVNEDIARGVKPHPLIDELCECNKDVKSAVTKLGNWLDWGKLPLPLVLSPGGITEFREACYPGKDLSDWLPSHNDQRRGYGIKCEMVWLWDQSYLSKKDILAAPMFTIFEGWKGRCQVRQVPDEWWVTSYIGCPAPSVEEALGKMHVGIEPNEVEKSDDHVDNVGDGVLIFDDLDAAICYLNCGNKLIKVPDSMVPDEKHWRLYVVSHRTSGDTPERA